MQILVTGANGQLGGELCRQLGTDALPIDIDTVDLADAEAVAHAVLTRRPDAVINCAACTQVDRAQTEAALCRAVNALAVEPMAAACNELGCPLVQISTDYVFGGPSLGRPWREDDPPAPQAVYAQTKLESERAAARARQHLIVRTCGLYARPSDQAARHFVKTMLRLADGGRPIRVVDDQHCTPSYVPHVARAVLFLLGWPARLPLPSPAPSGVYHVTNGGETTWHGFAAEIFHLAGKSVRLEPITTEQYNAPAPRPAYSVLDTGKYHSLGGPPMPPWQDGLREYFEELRSCRNALP